MELTLSPSFSIFSLAVRWPDVAVASNFHLSEMDTVVIEPPFRLLDIFKDEFL